jgi:hypothetical protein
MPKKLKTFQTSLGFYDVAIAALHQRRQRWKRGALEAICFRASQKKRKIRTWSRVLSAAVVFFPRLARSASIKLTTLLGAAFAAVMGLSGSKCPDFCSTMCLARSSMDLHILHF